MGAAVTGNPLRDDVCDKCGWQAFYEAYAPDTNGYLTFCGHHGQRLMVPLVLKGWTVVDHTQFINLKAGASA